MTSSFEEANRLGVLTAILLPDFGWQLIWQEAELLCAVSNLKLLLVWVAGVAHPQPAWLHPQLEGLHLDREPLKMTRMMWENSWNILYLPFQNKFGLKIVLSLHKIMHATLNSYKKIIYIKKLVHKTNPNLNEIKNTNPNLYEKNVMISRNSEIITASNYSSKHKEFDRPLFGQLIFLQLTLQMSSNQFHIWLTLNKHINMQTYSAE